MIYDTKLSIKVIKIIYDVVILQQNLYGINIAFNMEVFLNVRNTVVYSDEVVL